MSIQNNASILSLPPELVFPGIAQYTNSRDLINLSNTCTLMQRSNIDLWQKRFESTPTLKLPEELIFYGIGPYSDGKSLVNLFNTCKSMKTLDWDNPDFWVTARGNDRYEIRRAQLFEKNPCLRKVYNAFFRGDCVAIQVALANMRQTSTFCQISRNLFTKSLFPPVPFHQYVPFHAVEGFLTKIISDLLRNNSIQYRDKTTHICRITTAFFLIMKVIALATDADHLVGFPSRDFAISDINNGMVGFLACEAGDWLMALLVTLLALPIQPGNRREWSRKALEVAHSILIVPKPLTQTFAIAKASDVALTHLIKNPSKTALQLAAGAKFVAQENPHFAFFSIAMIFAMFALFDIDFICSAFGAMALYDIGSNLF